AAPAPAPAAWQEPWQEPWQAPWQAAAKRRRALLVALTLFSSAVATTLFANLQPDYDNLLLEYGQIALFALLSAWIV
ncbi:glucans biosynthesis glucosyltransferase MdoH, partial [Roseateles sp. GG27B]